MLITLGAGVLIGSGATWWLVRHRVVNDISQLEEQVECLRHEVEQLKMLFVEQLEQLKQQQRKCRLPTGYHSSVPQSSGDEDDVYEEAYDGPVPWLAGLGSNQLTRNDFDDAETLLHGKDKLNNVAGDNDETSLTSMFKQIDHLLEGSDDDKRQALRQLQAREQELSLSIDFVWRLSKATYFMSQIEASRDKEQQKLLVYKSKDYAAKALKLDDNCSNAHKWYAITLGSTGDYEAIAVKIQNGYKFKSHIERSIELNPTDPTGYYLLGRWCFGVYMLSWVERKMAATLFSAPPTATVDDALNNFLQADQLNPGKWKENLLFIAKCYIQKRDYNRAMQWLDKADVIKVCGKDDETCQKEVDGLIKQYSSYRLDNYA